MEGRTLECALEECLTEGWGVKAFGRLRLCKKKLKKMKNDMERWASCHFSNSRDEL